jgi:hypothetical protein
MKKLIAAALSLLFVFSIVPIKPATATEQPVTSFPGAEGAGKYVTGVRGATKKKEVYVVTTLEDYIPGKGGTPIEGSLRRGISDVDTKNYNTSNDGRVIVFAVSGVIHLKDTLEIKAKNLYMDGATAPGDGITIGDYRVKIGGGNSIIRNIRFRGGNAKLDDTVTVSANNMIIDHCSFSWSTDETLSMKGVSNVTVQWSIISDSLNASKHDKGAHGYGGIWGGNNVAFHHNLIMNHTSRNPRFDRVQEGNPTKINFVNNVIYNWGKESIYGGEGTSGVNMINNYLKYGPNTFDTNKATIVNPSLNDGGNWYVEGNYLEGFPEITADNWAGGVRPDFGLSAITRLKEPVDFSTNVGGIDYQSNVTAESAQAAYNSVLGSAGAVLPRRDALDARLVSDAKEGKGKLVNDVETDGGYPYENSSVVINQIPEGIMKSPFGTAASGYTAIEEYIHGLDSSKILSNPQVKFTEPALNSIFEAGKPVTFKVDAKALEGAEIEKVELLSNDKKLGSFTKESGSTYSLTVNNFEDGSYNLFAKATDSNKLSTLSSVLVIHVNNKTEIAPWSFMNIGTTAIKGIASVNKDEVTVKGSGSLGEKVDNQYVDAFGFAYQEIEGDFDITTEVGFGSAVDSEAIGGIMLRKDLTSGSVMAAIGMSQVNQFGYRPRFLHRSDENKIVNETNENSADSPYKVRLTRVANLVTGYAIIGGEWKAIGSVELDMAKKVYLGFAVDAHKSSSNFDYLSTFRFKGTTLNKASKITVNNAEKEEVAVPKYIVSGKVDEAMELTVVNNGKITVSPVNIGASGTFEYPVTLSSGKNVIEVSGKNSLGIITRKTITVNYTVTPAKISVTKVIPTEVTEKTLDLSMLVDHKAKVTVNLNGIDIMIKDSAQANEVVNTLITWAEDHNVLEIKAEDEYGVVAILKYEVNYNKNWKGTMFTVEGISMTKMNGTTVSKLEGVNDVFLTAALKNNSDVSKDQSVVIELIDAEGNVKALNKVKAVFQPGETKNIKAAFKLPQNNKGYSIKSYVVSNDNSAEIISNIFTVK